MGGRRSRTRSSSDHPRKEDQPSPLVSGSVKETAEWVEANRRSSVIVGVEGSTPTGGEGGKGAVSTPPRDRRPRPPGAKDVKR